MTEGRHRETGAPDGANCSVVSTLCRWRKSQYLLRPVYKFAPALMLWALLAQPVLASQTSCTFTTVDTPDYYEIEFIGYTDTNPVLVFSSTAFGSGKRIALPPADYTLNYFSRKEGRVGLEYRNPQNPALPPSFALAGIGANVWLTIGSARLRGELKCDH